VLAAAVPEIVDLVFVLPPGGYLEPVVVDPPPWPLASDWLARSLLPRLRGMRVRRNCSVS